MRKLLSIGALVALIIAAAGCKAVVTPQAPLGWSFLNESDSGGHGGGVYVNGPGTPPAGRGSALLSIDGTGREAITTLSYAGDALSSFSQLEYWTYQAYSGSAHETPNLAFDVDYDSTDSSTAYQGRLVFVPPSNAVQPLTWQQWVATGASAAWYSSASGSSTYRPIVNDAAEEPFCTQASFCTWQDVKDHYPNARVRPSIGQFMVRAGGPVTGGLVAAVDNVIVGIGSNAIENNFEPGDGHVAVTTANAASLGFGFFQETPNGTGSFASGPIGADGSGSAKFTVDASGGEALATGLYAGTPFANLDFLSYKTYKKGSSQHAVALQLDVDYDNADNTTAFQGRVAFDPAQASVQDDTWQTWNPLTLTTPSWFSTGTPKVGGVNQAQICTQGSPCTFSQLKSIYPNASIRPITGQTNGTPVGGGIWLKAGGGWSPGFTGSADSLTVALHVGSVNGTATYDFEP